MGLISIKILSSFVGIATEIFLTRESITEVYERQWMSTVNVAIYVKALKRIYCMNEEKRCSSSNSIRYSMVKAPVQQNGNDCGYYVCRNMIEIVQRRSVNIDPVNFSRSGMAELSYTDGEIDEIREQWASVVLPEVVSKRQ